MLRRRADTAGPDPRALVRALLGVGAVFGADLAVAEDAIAAALVSLRENGSARAADLCNTAASIAE